MKKIILILLFLSASFAQVDTLVHTGTQIDAAHTRALVNFNKTIYFHSEGSGSNSGLNINDPLSTLQEGLDKAFSLVPSNSNRILVISNEYISNNSSNYSIPDYVTVEHLSGKYTGTITLGDSAKFISYNEITSGGVTSVFGRTGAVVATANDYDISEIQYATDSLNTRVKFSDSLVTFITPTQLADSSFLKAADITAKVNYSDSLTIFTTPTQIADSAFLQASDITGKVNYSDSLTTFTTPTQIADSAFLQAGDITGKVNYSDSLITFVTPTQLADSVFLQAADIVGKIDYSDSLTVFTTPTQIADSAFLQASDIVGKVNYSDSLTAFVTPDQLADSLTFGTWKVFYSDASGKLTEIALGSSAQVLTSNGATSAPTFETPSSGFSDPMTTRGDIIYKNSSATTTRLGVGSADQALVTDGTDLSYQSIVNSIDTIGGAGATGNIFIKAGSNITVTRVLDTLTITSTASGGGGPTIIRKTSDETVNNSSTLQNDDDFTFSLASGERVYVKIYLSLIGASTTAGFKFAFSGSVADADLVGYMGISGIGYDATGAAGASTTASFQGRNSPTQSVVLVGASTNYDVAIFQANFINNNASTQTVVVKWAQRTAEAVDCTVRQDSWMEYTIE